MKKLLLFCGLLLLIGCSQLDAKDEGKYKGQNGTYEVLETRLNLDYGHLREEYGQLQWKLKYTNTTDRPIKPVDAIDMDLIIEQETDVELNEITFTRLRHSGEESELSKEEKLTNNGHLNIKPDATVEILVSAIVKKDNLDSIYLRNRNAQGKNGEKFEAVASVE